MKGLPKTAIGLLNRVFTELFPVIEKELNEWKKKAEAIPDAELRNQALASIETKTFHCQGGSVFALLAGVHDKKALRFIVAYQTISDYLDNLCDRSTSLDPDDFTTLHEAMKDALSPGNRLKNYYACREEQDDGGYLGELVQTCQNTLLEIEDYPLIKEKMLELEGLYAELQIHKHVKEEERLPRLIRWYNTNKNQTLGLRWNEFSAAAGSTLGIFCLAAYGFSGKLTKALIEKIVDCYFPYVQGLHILLDYYVDQEEDRLEGDLNFCNYYGDEVQMLERLQYFFILAEEKMAQLPDKQFHRYIPKGLVGLYLSDKKVKKLGQTSKLRKELLKTSGFTGRILHYNIRLYYNLTD